MPCKGERIGVSGGFCLFCRPRRAMLLFGFLVSLFYVLIINTLRVCAKINTPKWPHVILFAIFAPANKYLGI